MALLLTVVIIGAVVLEIFARQFIGVPLKEKLPLSKVLPDPDIGWVMVPSDKHYTYENLVVLNAMGFRDTEISGKLPGEYRILALGDSHIYGQGLGEQELMTTILEQELNKTSNSCQFNVINMGVRAFSTNNELAMLKKVGLNLEPDHVILFFFVNDFIPVNIESRYKRFSGMDWYTFDFSGKPTDDVIAKWKLAQAFRQSAFLMWIHDLYRSWTNKSNYINKILVGELDDDMRKNVEQTIKSLEEIRLLLEQQGIRFTLAVIPLAAQITKIHPDQRYQPILKEYALKSEVDFVDLLQDLRSYYGKHQDSLIIPFDGHYNAQGHKVMAGTIFNHLNAFSLCRE